MPLPAKPITPLDADALARFMAKVEINDLTGCHVWTACIASNGYGRVNVGGKNRVAHRVAYATLVGEIPEGMYLDHLCKNRACVNPDHLEVVTHDENMARGAWAQMTHCVNGHEFTDENTFVQHGKYRGCRTCRNESVRKTRARQREVVR